jgi:hypothetical protein
METCAHESGGLKHFSRAEKLIASCESPKSSLLMLLGEILLFLGVNDANFQVERAEVCSIKPC